MVRESPQVEPFRFRGGRLCLELTATLARRYRGGLEQLAEPGDLCRWLREAGLLAEPVTATIDADLLARTRELREGIYRLVHPDRTPLPDDRTLLNAWAARPVPAPSLGPDLRTVTWEAADPAEAALATVARDAIDLVSGGQADRVRECARPNCSVLFLDTSRTGQRRWCSMRVCGNQAKVARYRRRADHTGR